MTEAEAPISQTKTSHRNQVVSFKRISGINVDLTVELGKAKLTVEELMSLKVDDVVALNKMSNEPFDVKVNGQSVAEGEIVISEDQFYLKVTRIIDKVDYD